MRNLIVSWFLLSSIFCFSQQKDNLDSLKNSYKPASYKSGKDQFQKDFLRAIDFAVDGNYVVYGNITFSIFIDDRGKAKVVDVKPKLKNSQKLIEDLNFLLKKSNKNWVAAQKDNKPSPSMYEYQVKFNTEVYDHD